ncbi:uncharacterized protein PHACADRAFT_257011 [Phanerochaete carnosa HHB-10118-sp]|uniref:Uncharacterized protein n=1 Tax=Phanerochaete carnosa (strain HHB-10118-sp) TaxID=650164 RepID=K5W9X4_PHACS|nr:uncharacterized protein PHACADRAFT_257011 [Phanerochaete carnosa HHB-10118-sp]EKM56005.1 hypothetical protein PHACADRAFT_257011 [Phanerochaete carnosa HHB-10118-sp]
MATTLQLPSFPRHGILLNPSPSTSPYSHTTSLPGTPNLVSSLSSLSSSASSSSPHNLAEQDNYFLTYAAVRDPYSAIPRGGSSQNPGSSVSRNNSAKKPSSAPQTRRIRFAPLPEPRRDELQLPDVFLDDSVENLSNFPVSRDAIDTPRSNSGAPSSLLFSDHHTPSDSTPTTSNANLQLASSSKPTVAPINTASSSTSGSDKDDSSDWDITTPVSPNIALSSSVERLPQSCPESPLGRRPELSREKKSFTKKLLKPLLGPLGRSTISTEDVLTLGVNQLFRSSTRDSDDGLSSGAATPAGASTPARSHSKERSSSASDSECGFGVPLSRSTSDGAKKRKTFLGFSHGNSSSSDGGLWRTQSGPSDLRRVQSKEVKESEDATRPRRGSTNQMYGPGRQLRMLNGRVYGAKRSNLAKTNLFANARYVVHPPFVMYSFADLCQ